jgi:hypothetical protein
MKPTSDQIDIRSLAATKELQECVDTGTATDGEVERSCLELRRVLSLGSRSSSLMFVVSGEPPAFEAIFIFTMTRFKATDIYHGINKAIVRLKVSR